MSCSFLCTLSVYFLSTFFISQFLYTYIQHQLKPIEIEKYINIYYIIRFSLSKKSLIRNSISSNIFVLQIFLPNLYIALCKKDDFFNLQRQAADKKNVFSSTCNNICLFVYTRFPNMVPLFVLEL